MTTINNKYLSLVLTVLLLALVLPSQVAAQPSNYQFLAGTPPLAANVGASAVGVPGATPYFYWVIVTYPIGSTQPAGPAIVFNGNPTLSVSNLNRITWTPQLGANSYTVIRSLTQSNPLSGGSCVGCGVGASSTANSSIDDVGTSHNVSLSFVLPTNGSATLNNKDYAQARLVLRPGIYSPFAFFDEVTATVYNNLPAPVVQVLYDKSTFVICNGTPCTVAANLTNEYIFVNDIDFDYCTAFAKVAPTDADLIIDILLNGTTVFGATKLVIADGAQTGVQATFAIASAVANDLLTIDVTQIGSTLAGETVTVVCRMDVQ